MFATKASSRRLPGQVVSTLTNAVEGRTEAVTTFASTPKGRSPVRVRQVQKCLCTYDFDRKCVINWWHNQYLNL